MSAPIRVEINLPGDDDQDSGRPTPRALVGHVRRTNNRMRHDYPECEFWVVKKNHAKDRRSTTPPGESTGKDNTFDLIDGSQEMLCVPAPFDRFAWRYLLKGMTVVVRYKGVSRQLPYISGMAPAHKKKPGPMLWSRANAGPENNFSTEDGAGFTIATLVPAVVSSSYSESDLDYGAGQILIGYTSGPKRYLATLARTAAGYCVLVGIDLDDPTLQFFSDPHDGSRLTTDSPITYSHQANPLSIQYCPAEDLLIVLSSDRAILLQASPGVESEQGAILFDDSIYLDDPPTVTGNLLGSGSGVAGSVLVNPGLFYAYDNAYTPTSNDGTGTIRAYSLKKVRGEYMVEAWRTVNMRTLFSGTYPIVLSQFSVLGIPRGTIAPAYDESRNTVYTVVAGREGIPHCTPAGTYPAVFDAAETIPANYVHVYYDNRTVFTQSNRVSPDTYTAMAQVLAIVDGEISARYTFPQILAEDNFEIDTNSFSFSLAAGSATILNSVYGGLHTVQNESVGAMPGNLSIDLSAGSYAASGHPSWETPTDYRTIVGSLRGVYNSRTWTGTFITATQSATVGGQQYLYPHIEHIPAPGGYHFDPTPYIARATTSLPTFTTAPEIVLDQAGNLYLHYLTPWQIISARHNASGDIIVAHKITAASMSAIFAPASGGEITVEWFGTPRILTMYRSFLISLTPRMDLRWQIETTKYLTDTEDGSGLSLPHGSFVWRMIPTSKGLLVLRTERTADFSSLPIAYNSARFAGVTRDFLWTNYTSGNNHAGDHEPLLWAKLILELRGNDGSVVWSQTLWDPTGTGTPTCIPAASMWATSQGVIGRFDHSTATWGSAGTGMNYGNYSLSATVGTMFACDLAGNVTTRAATDEDPQANGINIAPDLKVRVNAAHAILDGKLYYNGWNSSDSKWVIARLE